MYGSRLFFVHLNQDFHTSGNFGDTSKTKVVGKGDFQIKTKDDNIETTSNVFLKSIC